MSLQNFRSPLFHLIFLAISVFGGNTLLAQTLKTSDSNGNWGSIAWTPAGNPTQANNVNLGHTVTIEKDSIVKINDLEITNNGKLTVNGTLVINGNLTMKNNGSEFSMGPDSVVIIYGNFLSANKIDINISSYLIIHGDFKKTGSDDKGSLDVEDGNIYIFGEVSGWDNFGSCTGETTYNGETPVEDGTCDYGDKKDFEDNYEDFPEEVTELENCLETGIVESKNVCAGASAIFSIPEIQGVTYQWQTKKPGDMWKGAESTVATFTIENTILSMSGTLVRVVIRTTQVDCKIAISNAATLTVSPSMAAMGAIIGPAEVCSGTENLIYSVPAVEGAKNYSWTLPSGWTILSGGDSKEINVKAEAGASSGTIKAEVTGACDSQFTTFEVKVPPPGEWTGISGKNWNNPANWSCGVLPTLETNVKIPANLSSGNYPEITSGENALAKDLLIEAGASITVTGNRLRIAGAVQNSGVFDAKNGSISFEGTTAQTIPAKTFKDNRLENLQIDNASGVTSAGTLEITGILKITNGNFNTGNALTLISSAEKTALIDGSGNGEVTGTVIMQRYLEPAFGYKYFSSPFSETKAGDFTDIDLTASFPNFYRYDENRNLTRDFVREDATGWEPITDAATELNILEGYALNFGTNTNATVVELSGTVNNGSYSRTIENNNREYTRGFHLIGNPYPSPIDWDAAEGWIKTNIEDGIYFFTAGESQYTGTYTSYVNGISSEDGKASNIIPSMQGFFVKVVHPAEGVAKVTGTLGVTNKVRVADFDQEFLKTPEREEKSLLRFTASYDGIGKKDGMVIYFSKNSVTGFNKDMDAHKLLNTDTSVPNLYSLSEDKVNSSIKALPFPESGSYEKIPLGITAGRSGKMVLDLSDLQNIPSYWNIYLIDKEKRMGQDLRKKTSYSFSIKEGEHHERFQLMFSKEKIQDPVIAFDDKFSVDSGEFLRIKLNLEEGQTGELRVITVTGQLLEVKEGRGKEQVEFRSITSSGIYFINMIVDGRRYSKKVLLSK